MKNNCDDADADADTDAEDDADIDNDPLLENDTAEEVVDKASCFCCCFKYEGMSYRRKKIAQKVLGFKYMLLVRILEISKPLKFHQACPHHD